MLVWGDDKYQREHWDEALPFVTYSINITKHKSTGFSPFELIYGRKPVLRHDMVNKEPTTVHQLYARLVKLSLDHDLSEAYRSNKESQMRSRKYYDDSQQARTFEVGDLVWVHLKDARRPKLSSRYGGPYVIIAKRANDVYEVKHLETNAVILRHVSAFKPCIKNSEHENEEAPSDPKTQTPSMAGDESTPNEGSDDEIPATAAPEPELEPAPVPNLPHKHRYNLRSLAAALVMLFMLIQGPHPVNSTEQLLTPESPILWRKTDKVVLRGIQEYEYTIVMESPCLIFNALTTDNVLNNHLFVECQTLYKNMIIEKMRLWCAIPPSGETENFETTEKYKRNNMQKLTREKKQLAMSLAAGMSIEWCINRIYDTVTGYFRKSMSVTSGNSDENGHIIADEINQLRRTVNTTLIVQNARRSVLEGILSNQAYILNNLQNLNAAFPHSTWTSIYISNLIFEKSRHLDDVIHEWRRGRISESLGHFLNVSDFINPIPEATSAHSCEMINAETFTIQFWMKVIDKHSHILQADPFKIYTNLTGHPILREYQGPDYIIYNRSSDCTAEADVSNARFNLIFCKENHKHEDLTTSWRALFNEDNIKELRPLETVKIGQRANYIYCFPGNITIQGASTRCPPYVFKLDNTIPWNLTHKSYAADGSLIKVQALLGIGSTINVPSAKMAPEGLTIFDALQRIQEMQTILNRFDKQTLDLTDHTKQVIVLQKHNALLDFIIFILGIILVIMIVKYIGNCGRCRGQPPTILVSQPREQQISLEAIARSSRKL